MMVRLILTALLLPLAAGAQALPGDQRIDSRDVRVCGRAGCVMAGNALTWDGSVLSYTVPGGPRVCIVVGPSCPGLLPSSAAVLPASPVTDASGNPIFDPATGLFISPN